MEKLLQLKCVKEKGKVSEVEQEGVGVGSAGTTLSSSPGSARSRRHKQSLEPSVAHTYWRAWHTKKLRSVQCSACEELQDFFRVSAVVLKFKGVNAFFLHGTCTRHQKSPNSFSASKGVSERKPSTEIKELKERGSRNPRRFKIAHASYLLPIWSAAQETIRYKTFLYVINFSVTLLQKRLKRTYNFFRADLVKFLSL